MGIPDAAVVADALADAIDEWVAATPRSAQQERGEVGISDIGDCREKTRWIGVGQEPTDEPHKYEAFIGTWLGEGIEEATNRIWPHAKRKMEVTVELPSGRKIPGHPDLVLPGGVIDIKTVDGLTAVKRTGPDVGNQFQRHLYGAALVQAGELDEDCWVGNAWFDRSGRTRVPHVQFESYDPTWLSYADDWIDDVEYAIKHSERAMQDRPIEWCEKVCQFYTICRGPDARKDRESQGLITDIEKLSLVEAIVEAKAKKKEAEKIIEDARRGLAGVSGTTEDHIVRWVFVDESSVPGHTRAAYHKLDVRKIPRPKK